VLQVLRVSIERDDRRSLDRVEAAQLLARELAEQPIMCLREVTELLGLRAGLDAGVELDDDSDRAVACRARLEIAPVRRRRNRLLGQ
jgi:hypothetical protein